MKILVLEDSEKRIKWFREKFGNEELFIATNVEIAKRNFEWFQPFDMIFLDHDLDGRVYVESNEKNTGYQFAKYLAEKGVDSERVILHTMNQVGAGNMKSALPNSIYIPFTYMRNAGMVGYIRKTIENYKKEQ